MAIRSVAPIREILERKEDTIIPFVPSEASVQTALTLYRQNRIYDFVNRAMTVWTDWRVFARLAIVVDDCNCTEHGDKTPGIAKIQIEDQLPFRRRNLAILKTLVGYVIGPLNAAMQDLDPDAYLCFALLLRVGMIEDGEGRDYKQLVEKAMALGCVEAKDHYAAILSQENEHAIFNAKEILQVCRTIVELKESVAMAGYARVAREMGFVETNYLKQKFDSERYIQWVRVAADFGCTWSMADVGHRLMYDTDSEPTAWEKGLEMLECAYGFHSPTAAYYLGRVYSCNKFVVKDSELALKYFDTAKKWKKREFVGTFAGTRLSFVKMRDLDQCVFSIDSAIDELLHSIPSTILRDVPDGRDDGHNTKNDVYFINDLVRHELGYDGAVNLIRKVEQSGVDSALQDIPVKLLQHIKDFVVMTDCWCGVDMSLFQWSGRDQAFSCHFHGDHMPYWGEEWQLTPPPPQMSKDTAHKIMRYLNDR